MEQVERSKPRRSYAWLWMILSFVMIAAFMTWLGLESKPAETPVQTAQDTSSASAIPLVSLDTFALHPGQYVGQQIRLQNVKAQSAMGAQGYWLDMPTKVPFLLEADSALAASGGFSMEVGTAYNVTAFVVAMTDSVLDAWEKTGAIKNKSERMQAEFATDFLEASAVQAASGQGGSSGGTGSGQ